MLWANKKLTQSVTFTEDGADQTLLEAIDKELSQAKYQTFSNLCKQALWQFLILAESQPKAPPSSTPTDYQPLPNFQKVEDRLLDLHNKLSNLEQQVLATNPNSTESLERQLSQLAQQLTQVQTTINHRLAEIAHNLESAQLQSHPGSHQVPSPEPKPEPLPPPVVEETDPLLKRLGSLLDDF